MTLTKKNIRTLSLKLGLPEGNSNSNSNNRFPSLFKFNHPQSFNERTGPLDLHQGNPSAIPMKEQMKLLEGSFPLLE